MFVYTLCQNREEVRRVKKKNGAKGKATGLVGTEGKTSGAHSGWPV